MSRNGARPRLGRRRRYDQKKAVEALRQTMLTVAMVSFIHYKWGSPMPLVFQCITQPMNMLDAPLVKIHFFSAKPIGKLARPWKAPPNPLQEMLGGDKEDEKAVARKQD
mmetsp:Transcript_30328/g.93875  ORF Transcript_30328/g.93875 Transcript_30328/m.93875 type:complete len:109 (-) Transcript_30328:123-449(-)